MRAWRRKQRIGFSVKSMEELVRVVALGVNLVEIKLEKFADSGTPLYFYCEQRYFRMNRKVLRKIVEICGPRGVAVQFHLPIENAIDLRSEKGINIGVLEHHDVAIARFRMFERIYAQYGIGSVITMHPPVVSVKGEEILDEKTALENAKTFFLRLDKLRMKEDHQTLIGVENQPDKKVLADNLGYLTGHFKKMIRSTRTIGITIDSGHRRLARGFKISEFISISIDVVNFHFHGNAGKFIKENYDDDEHQLPTEENVTGYKNYLHYFRRHRTPVILEIANLARYTDAVLRAFVRDLMEKLK